MTTRRGFLRGLAAAGGLAGLGLPRLGRAASLQGVTIGDGTVDRSYKILEIMVYLGLSNLETSWATTPLGSDWRSTPDIASISSTISRADMLNVGADAEGQDVYMGCCVRPFERTDLLRRMRLVAMSHGNFDHVASAISGLTGLPGGHPNGAGMAARVNARHGRGASVVIHSGRTPAIRGALATGRLGESLSPLLLPISDSELPRRFQRTDFLGEPAEDLLDFYSNHYEGRLTHTDGRLRSRAFDTYLQTLSDMRTSDLREFIASSTHFDGPVNGYDDNAPMRAIGLAADMLAETSVRHACVFVGHGVNGGIDTHTLEGEEHATRHVGALWSILASLQDTVDLDETMVVIHSEFGRARRDSDGSEHSPLGYPALLIGGPIRTRALSVAGSMTLSGGGTHAAGGFDSSRGFSQADLACAMTLASGIDPFHEELFDLEDTTARHVASTAAGAREALAQTLLGVSNATVTTTA